MIIDFRSEENNPFWESPILASKTSIPPMTANYVVRPRLLGRLQESWQHKLTLLDAPAGFGKTMLTSAWLHSHSVHAAWLSLEPDDNDFKRFWIYAAAAIERQCPGFLSKTIPIFQSFHNTSAITAISFFLNELAQIPTSLLLVLDDYHVITDTTVHDSLVFLLEHLPASLHLVILSRTIPPLPLARLRAQKQLLQIDGNELRFTLEEIKALEEQSLAIPLSASDLSRLEQKTEGWAAGLTLAFISIRMESDHSAFIESFSGNHRYILDYLMDEVMLRQSIELQTFLQQTSILNRMSADLAEALTGNTQSRSLFTLLERENMFFFPLDHTRTWYRFHHLFADMLQDRLEEKFDSAEVKELHRRAYTWYDAHEFFSEAIHHALRAGDYDFAAQCMERNFTDFLRRREESTLMKWLEAIPFQNIVRHPDLMFYQAAAMATSGHPQHAIRFFDRIETSLHTEADLLPQDVRQEIQLRMGLYHLSAAYYQGDVDLFVRLLSENMDGLARYPSIINVVNTGEALLYRGPLGFGGRLKKMAYMLEIVSKSENIEAAIHHALQGQSYIYLADLYYEWNRVEEARSIAEKALVESESSQNIDMLVPGIILMSKIHQACGDWVEASETIERGIHSMQAVRSPRSQLLLEARNIRMQVYQEAIEAGITWVQKRHLQVPDNPPVAREYEHITLARVLIADKKIEEAKGSLRRLLSSAKQADRLGSQIEILLLLALTLHYEANYDEAACLLAEALRIGESEGYIRLFLDEGKPIMDLLSWWTKHDSSMGNATRAYAKHLLALHEGKGSAGNSNRINHCGEPITLTKREKEVLELIGEGLSNESIARKLIISPGTVKRYIHHLYQKLDSKNRVQAVSKARELELL